MHFSPRLPILAAALAAITCGGGAATTAAAQNGNVTISIDTSKFLAVPSRSNFAGANMMIMNTGTSYKDVAMQNLVKSMHLGWARFPGGTNDDAWDRTTGTMNPNWVGMFANETKTATYNALTGEMKTDGGKVDKNSITNFAAFLNTQTTGSPGNAPTHFIGVVNVFTDIAPSAGSLVSDATAAGLTGLDDVWELGNEPSYFNTDFFKSPSAYLTKIGPYATAMHGVNKNIQLALWVDPNDSTWNKAMGSYNNPYVQQFYTHLYPTPPDNDSNKNPVSTWQQFVAFYNEFLLDKTNTFFDTTLVSEGLPSNYSMEVSEYNIQENDNYSLKSSQYNAIFVAEYLLRLAKDAHITHAGMHLAVTNDSVAQEGVVPAYDYITECQTAYASGPPFANTADPVAYNMFNYSMYPSGMALQIVDEAINTGTGLWQTDVSGGTWVAYDNQSGTAGNMPGVYAQAVAHATNPQHLLLTNKSSLPQTVTVKINDTVMSNTTFTPTYLTAPYLYSTPANATFTVVNGPPTVGYVTLPPYSVMNVAFATN